MTEGKRAIIQGLLQEYDIQSTEDIQDVLKVLLGGTDVHTTRGNATIVATDIRPKK